MAEVNVRGLRELNRAFTLAGKEAVKVKNAALRDVAEPIRMDAQSLAATSIPRIGPRWSRMRTGVTRVAVYVAPRSRGARGGPKRRPRFADLMEQRAMRPALERNRGQIESRMERAFYGLAGEWNRRG